MAILARSEPRDGYAVRVLAVHTTEGGGTAQALRDAAWWTGSSHAIADKTGTLLTPAEGCVPYDRAAWTLRSGNRWSENIELVGYARYTRQEWLDEPALLAACAKWLAARSKARGIPLVKLTPQQYRAGASGVIGHHDHTIGYSDGTHWDPGPGFPWDVVLERARDYAGGVNIEPEDIVASLDELKTLLEAEREATAQRVRQVIADGSLPYGLDTLRRKLDVLAAQVAAADANDAPGLIADAVVAVLPDTGSGPGGSISRADVEAALRSVLGGLDAT